jgi:hypothetical protein
MEGSKMEHIERTSYRPFAVGGNASVLKTVKTVNAETNDIESRDLQREVALLENICLQDAIDSVVAKPSKPNLLGVEYFFNSRPVFVGQSDESICY